MVDQQVRMQIKTALIQLLAIEDMNSIKYAGVCISAIGAIEVPLGEWPNLIEMLCSQA